MNDELLARDVWDLIRMLATNENMYQKVLSAVESDEVDWATFFLCENLYEEYE